MHEWWLAVLSGIASGGLLLAGHRRPLLAWGALAPLGLVMVLAAPAPAALAGGIAGALGNVRSAWSPTMRALLPLNVGLGLLSWAIAFGAAAWALPRDEPAWLPVLLPAAAVAALLPARLAGAPRWVSNPLACTQEPWLGVVHTARLGGDLVTSVMLALASAVLALVILAAGGVSSTVALVSAAGGAFVVALVLAFGMWSARVAARRADVGPTVRIATVVDGPSPPGTELHGLWPMQSPDYRDVEGTVRRYAPHVERAVHAGARLIVLPEVCVLVDSEGRARWIDAVTRWAASHHVTIVAPFFDRDTPRNELVVIDDNGVVGTYEKQHPAPRLEPARTRRAPPGPHPLSPGEQTALSTVICVDLDYPDLVRPVRAAGGILVAPSNDWFGGFEELHHRTAVWSAALTGVTTVRATGHGISSVIDGAGRVLARQSSRNGAVVLVVDAPVTPPPG